MPGLEDIGLENPSANEVLFHPDERQVATFFVGVVFLLTLQFLWRGRPLSLIRLPLRRFIHTRLQQKSNDLEEGRNGSSGAVLFDEKALREEVINSELQRLEPTRSDDPRNLVFCLTMVTAIACVSQVSALMAYSPASEKACAAAVAFNGLASQSIRLIGLLKLAYVLKDLGVKRLEYRVFMGLLGVAIVLMIFMNATSVGTVRQLSQLPQFSFCYRKHLALSGLLTGLLNLTLEMYTVVRVLILAFPKSPKLQHPVNVLLDIRIGWGCSLVMMDLLTLAPTSVPISVAADYVPFSITAVAVLYAFNHRSIRRAQELSVTSVGSGQKRIPIVLDDPIKDDASMISVDTEEAAKPNRFSKPPAITVLPHAAARDPELQTASWATPTRPTHPTVVTLANAAPGAAGGQHSPSSLVPFSFRQGGHRHSHSVSHGEQKRFFPEGAPLPQLVPRKPAPPEIPAKDDQHLPAMPSLNYPEPVHYDNTVQRFGASSPPRSSRASPDSSSPGTGTATPTPRATRPRISVSIPVRIARQGNTTGTPPATGAPKTFNSQLPELPERQSSRDLTERHRDTISSISTLSSPPEFGNDREYFRGNDSPPDWASHKVSYPADHATTRENSLHSDSTADISPPVGMDVVPVGHYREPSPAMPAQRTALHAGASTAQPVLNPFMPTPDQQRPPVAYEWHQQQADGGGASSYRSEPPFVRVVESKE